MKQSHTAEFHFEIACGQTVMNGIKGASDLPDIYPLYVSRLGISADAIPDGLTFELRVAGLNDDPPNAPGPKERVRIFPSGTANATGIIGPKDVRVNPCLKIRNKRLP